MQNNLSMIISNNINKNLYQNPELGICIIFKSDKFKKWFAIQATPTHFWIDRIISILINNKYSDFEHDFAIINKNGEILYSNCIFSLTINDNGIISIDDSLFIKPIENKNRSIFISGTSIDELIKKINSLINQKIISKRSKLNIDPLQKI